MIPLRVKVKNFLCHAEQEFDFEGRTLWLLHGPNGVGKSAVFDAIVYALFGEHQRRDGPRTEVADIIRHGEKSLRVDFEFEYAGVHYHVWRTRSRAGAGNPKQGVNVIVDGAPTPLPNINGVGDFKAWVAATLGLTYAAFVSAVLLRQGAAERLIDADKKERVQLLRGIIDLEAYEALYKKTFDTRADKNALAKTLREQFKGTVEVTDAEVEDAAALKQQKHQAAEQRQAEERAVRDTLGHARRWEELEQDRTKLTAVLQEAAARQQQSDALRRDVERLKELQAAIPARKRWFTASDAAKTAASTLMSLQEQLEAVDTKRRAAADAAAESQRLAGLERDRVQALRSQVIERTHAADKLQQAIDQSESAADLHRQLQEANNRLANFAADLDMQLTAADEAAAAAQAAKDAHPHLKQVHEQRDIHRSAVHELEAAATLQTSLARKLAAAITAEVEAGVKAQAAAEAFGTADHAVTAARTQYADTQKRQTKFLARAGEETCSECGQPIDAAHVEREKAKFANILEEAALAGARLKEAAALAKTQRDEAQRHSESAARLRQELDSECKLARQRLQQLRPQADAARHSFDDALRQLAEPVAARVVPIDAVGFPTADDVAAAKTLASELPARHRLRKTLSEQVHDRNALTASLAPLRQAVQAVGAPANVTATRADHAVLLLRIQTLKAEIDATAQSEQQHEQQRKQHAAEEELHARQTAKLTGEMATATTAKALADKEAADAEAALPECVRGEVDVTALEVECRRLVAGDVEKQFAALEEDRRQHADRERRLAEIVADIDRLPAVGRRFTADVRDDIAAAEIATAAAITQANAAAKALDDMQRRRQERADLESRMLAAERDHSLNDRLVDLLGPEGLQRDLLRDAERRIFDHANDLLPRISAGDLRFEPPAPDGDRAFDLRVRRLGVAEPIAVGNLSGGQRCRVAVALALAVCRFACGEARPLESIIIDEAFASLDRDGRLAMIDVLRDGTLAGGMLKRIIVVSHHEDVLAAFTNGYTLTNADGVTRVEQFGPVA